MCRMEKAGKFGRICKKGSFSRTFSRHDIVQASLPLFIWLNENVLGKGSFSVKTGAFMKYAAISYRFNLAAIA